MFGGFGKEGFFKQGSSTSWAWKLMFLGLGAYLIFGEFYKQRDWTYTEFMEYVRKRQFTAVRVFRTANPNYKPGKEKNVDMLIASIHGKEVKTITPDLEATLRELSILGVPVSFKVNT